MAYRRCSVQPLFVWSNSEKPCRRVTDKEVIFRIDVDTPTGSLLLNKLHLKRGYLGYLRTLIALMKQFGIKASFMFIPGRTTPSPEILGEILDTDSEIALHAVEVIPETLCKQKAEMEKDVGRPILGISYHGRDLLDSVLHELTRKSRYVAYYNPFESLLAGFRYDATGYSYLPDEPTFLHLSERRILLFKGYVDITWGSRYGPPMPKPDDKYLRQGLNIFMIHPNYLDRYGFRRATRDDVRAVFGHVVKQEARVRTYAEVCEEHEGVAGHCGTL